MSDPLAPLRARFRERAAGDLTRLQELAAGDLGSEPLKMLAHNIAGAAGTFGYPLLSEAAISIDDRFAVGETPDTTQVALLIERLRAVVEGP